MTSCANKLRGCVGISKRGRTALSNLSVLLYDFDRLFFIIIVFVVVFFAVFVALLTRPWVCYADRAWQSLSFLLLCFFFYSNARGTANLALRASPKFGLAAEYENRDCRLERTAP